MARTDDPFVTTVTSAGAAAIRRDLEAFARHLRQEDQRLLREEVLIHLPGKSTWDGKNVLWVMNGPPAHRDTICKWLWEWMTELERAVAKTIPDWETRVWDCAETALVHLCPESPKHEPQYQARKSPPGGMRGRGGAHGGRGRGMVRGEVRGDEPDRNLGEDHNGCGHGPGNPGDRGGRGRGRGGMRGGFSQQGPADARGHQEMSQPPPQRHWGATVHQEGAVGVVGLGGQNQSEGTPDAAF
eukprot:2640243-Rhodomonas_salina.2